MMNISRTTRIFDTPDVASASGISQHTLLAWRRRHGVCGGVEPNRGGASGYRYNFVDVCVVTTIAVLTRHGIGLESAISAEAFLRTTFLALLSRAAIDPLFVFTKNRRPPFFSVGPREIAEDITKESGSEEAVTIVDLRHVLARVSNTLEDGN